jgi:hypothetical protein
MVNITQYKKLNHSYKKKLVYHLGGEAGFFSEYNNMILAMLYCLEHKIKFILYSQDANFGFEKGWQDYFLPFCNESSNKLHSKLNPRQILSKNSYSFRFKQYLLKKLTGTNYLTSDLWNKFHSKDFENETFDIPQLEIYGKTQQACKKLIDITWRFNSETQDRISQLIQSVNVSNPYLGFHIRGGDKSIEYASVDLDQYIQLACKISGVKKAFVLTDDYRIFTQLQIKYPDWKFYSLCTKEEIGYVHQNFKTIDSQEKRHQMIRLFASIEILNKSDHFIGTFSSNPGMYLGMRMNAENVHGVDFNNWTIW